MHTTETTVAAGTKSKRRTKTAVFVEGAIMAALATVLSYVRIFHFPWGGSITLLSMLPIAIYSIRHGMKNGMMVSFLFALIQLAQGIVVDGLLAWGLTPVMLIGCIMLDYILPFTVLGFAGMLRRKGTVGAVAGTTSVIVLRFASHTLSGVVIFHSAGKLWEGFSTDNEWLYSLLYNGAYMLPELVFTLVGAVILLRLPQTRKLFAANS